MIITVDCGTTNMRCRLYEKKNLLYEVKKKAGVRNTAFDGSSDMLAVSLSSCIKEILEKNNLDEKEVEIVICTGTLASDVGIYHGTSHAVCPAGIEETLEKSHLVSMPEITGIPVFFIPGVKTLSSSDETDEMKKVELADSMSGEESEIYGIIQALGLKEDFVAVLPGSYVKTSKVSGEGKILSIKTGMCGELIAALSEHTLLKNALPAPVIKTTDSEALIFGFDYASKHGVSPSVIKTRNARLHLGWDENRAANFFIGALLYDDIVMSANECEKGKKVIVGGSSPLREIFAILLSHMGVENIITLGDDISRLASNFGGMRVWERFNE